MENPSDPDILGSAKRLSGSRASEGNKSPIQNALGGGVPRGQAYRVTRRVFDVSAVPGGKGTDSSGPARQVGNHARGRNKGPEELHRRGKKRAGKLFGRAFGSCCQLGKRTASIEKA